MNGATETPMKIHPKVCKRVFTNALLVIHKNSSWLHDQLITENRGEFINSEIKAYILIIN
jgi:hypothetical protein